MVTHAARPDARPVAARLHPMVRGHGTGRVRHGQLHVVLLSDVPSWPTLLPGRRASGGRRLSGARVPWVPVATVEVAAQPELRDRLHTRSLVQRPGNMRPVADVPEHGARPCAQRHRCRRGVRHIRPVRYARLPGRQHVILLPLPATRQPGCPCRRRVRRMRTTDQPGYAVRKQMVVGIYG